MVIMDCHFLSGKTEINDKDHMYVHRYLSVSLSVFLREKRFFFYIIFYHKKLNYILSQKDNEKKSQ